MASKKTKKPATAEVIEEVAVEEKVEEVIKEKAEAKSADKYSVKVTATRLNVRKKPNKEASVVKVLDKGTVIEVEDSSIEGWLFTNDKVTGFIMKEFTERV